MKRGRGDVKIQTPFCDNPKVNFQGLEQDDCLNFEPDELFYNHLPACVLFTALATLVEEYIQAANSPGAVPVVESAWNVFTKTKCTQTLNDAKALYE